jgi:hypothetical protein
MSLLQTDWNPSRRQLRHFTWAFALVLGWISWSCSTGATGLGLRLVAAGVFATGTIWPALFGWLYRAVVAVTFPVGWVVGHVLLAVVYFGLITPLAAGFRLLGRDPLGRRFEPEAESYWQPRARVTDYRRYLRQF